MVVVVAPLLLPPALSPEDLEGACSPLLSPELRVVVPEDLSMAVPPLRELELEEPLLAVLPLLRVLPELFELLEDTSEPRERPLVLVLLEELLMVPPWALVVLWLPLFTWGEEERETLPEERDELLDELEMLPAERVEVLPELERETLLLEERLLEPLRELPPPRDWALRSTEESARAAAAAAVNASLKNVLMVLMFLVFFTL